MQIAHIGAAPLEPTGDGDDVCKIGAQHRARKAVLYVRQSSAHQVQHNRESRTLQYAMRDRLALLGWSEIEVIDENLGRSAGPAQVLWEPESEL